MGIRAPGVRVYHRLRNGGGKMKSMTVKYQVIPVGRYRAVRFELDDSGTIFKSESCGEFENGSLAYSAACAMHVAEQHENPGSDCIAPDIPGWLEHDLSRKPPRFSCAAPSDPAPK